MVIDYHFTRHGNIHVPSLYTGKASIYWYTFSTNWRAILAWCCGMCLGLPGMIGLFQPSAVAPAATNMYRLGWLLTFTTAAVIYVILCWIFPVVIYPAEYRDAPVSFEYLGRTDGYFDGERNDIIEGVDIGEKVVNAEVIAKEGG